MTADSDELARFREQWRAEVRQRTNQKQNHPSATAKDTNVDAVWSVASVQRVPDIAEKHPHPAHKVGLSSTPVPTRSSIAPTTSSGFSRALTSAVETYRLAIQYEQAGDLDEALRLYRNAFRLDSNVDKAYHREEQRLEVLAANSHVHKENAKPASHDAKESIPAKVVARAKQIAHRREDPGVLAHLISTFPTDLDFETSDERVLAPLHLLPDEVIILILKTLDPHSLERLFAVLNRKARVLSLDSSIWRDVILGPNIGILKVTLTFPVANEINFGANQTIPRDLVQRTYVPPQIQDDLDIDSLAEQYMSNYRRLYIEHPRLRLDGVYIAVCHYVRPGLNADNVWVRVSHLITYHRYLRFLPDGTVISLLANEDVEPQTIIPLLKPSLRMKGLCIGNWSLGGTTIVVRDLVDPSGGNTRYTFQMTLTLRSKPLGRWNKLDLAGYDSVNRENGEAIPLGLKHERPFWFSKVKSYAV